MHTHIFGLLHTKKELTEIYLNRIIRSLAFSLIGVFVPIYLLKLGFLLNEVLMFILLSYAFFFLFSPLSAKVESKVGIKHTISLGSLLAILFFLLLFTVEYFNWSLLFIALVQGASWALYYIPFNADFVRNSEKGRYGIEVSLLAIVPHLTAIIAPLIGALVITSFNFNILLLTVSILMVISVIPLFATRDPRYKLKKGIRKMFRPENSKYIPMYLVKGMIFACVIIWPIYVFYFLEHYIVIGIVDSIKGVAAAIFTFLIGWFIDRFRLNIFFKIAAILNFIIWLSVFFVGSSQSIFVLSFLVSFALISMTIPTFVLSTKIGKRNPTEFMVFRESILNIGRILMFVLMIILPFEYKFQVAFILTALASLYLLIFKPE